MKMLKIFGWLIGLVVALIIAVLIYISLNLNSLVKRAVEETGPKLTQTPVNLNKVDLSLKEGQVSLHGFAIENPQDFTSDNAFSFNEFTLKLSPESLAGKVIIIEDIVISGIAITAEQMGSKTNLQEIKKAIDSYLPPGSGADNSEESAGGGKRFMLKHIKFDDASLKLITEKYGEKAISLPGFEMSNIGSVQEGLTAEQLASITLKALTDRARRAVEKELRDQMTEEATAKAKEKIEEKKQQGLDKLKGLLNE